MSWFFRWSRPSGVYLRKRGLVSRLIDDTRINPSVTCGLGWVALLEELLNEVDVGHHHATAAVPPKAELIHSIACKVSGSAIKTVSSSDCELTRQGGLRRAGVGSAPTCHRQPASCEYRVATGQDTAELTFPHEKQRTGIIILATAQTRCLKCSGSDGVVGQVSETPREGSLKRSIATKGKKT